MAHVACAEAYRAQARRFAERNTAAYRDQHYFSRHEREQKKQRAIQLYLGHKNIQHTVRYTELASGRFRISGGIDESRAKSGTVSQLS